MCSLFHSASRVPALPAMAVACAAAACLALAGGMPALAQQAAGTHAAAIEAEELNAALAVARKQLEESEARASALDASSEALRESLIEANLAVESLRAEHEELLLRMAALGVDLLKPDPKSLEQRLLHAVRELERAEQEKEALALQLARLSETAVLALQAGASGAGEWRDRLETEIQASDATLGLAAAGPAQSARPMSEARVVSVDAEIGLAVLNVGRGSGVRVGMPLTVTRDARPVGAARVVDVRETVCGALLEELSAGAEVRVGDRAEPRPDAGF